MPTTLVKPAYIHHVFFKTKRFDSMRRFYKLVFGCEPLFENDQFSWLTFDQEHHRIAIYNAPESEDQTPNSEGLDHIGYQYLTPEDLFATYERLREASIEPFWCTNHGATTSFYYRDPDGNGLELQYDNYDSMDDLQEWLASGDFARNPVGVDVDPGRLISSFRSGVGRLDLHQRSRQGEFLPDGMSMEDPAAPFLEDPMSYLASIRQAVDSPT